MSFPLQEIRLVVFDCDGTLVDSLAGIARVMNMALSQVGLAENLSLSCIGGVVGLSMAEAMAALFPAAPAALRGQAIAVYKEHYKRLADGGELISPLFPGVRQTLDRLRAHGLQLAMATGKSMRGVERTIAEHQLAGYFRFLKSADCAPSKPDPAMVRQIVQESGFAPRAILMVGDTDFDMIMGRQAGVVTCAVTYGCHPRARLAAAQPDYWLDGMGDLPGLLGLKD